MPLYPSDLDEKKKLKRNKVYSCEIKFERNYEFLKKFMALCKVGHKNTTNFIDSIPFDVYRKWVTIQAGFYDMYKTKKGTMVEAKSISFDSMEEDEFQKVYDQALDIVIKDIGVTREEIEDNLINFF